MKKILAILAISAIGFGANAQKKGDSPKFSVGLDLGLPMGTFGDASKMGIGGSAKYHHELNDNGALTGTVGFTSFSSKFDGAPSSSLLSVKAGYQYKMEGGIYIEPQVGFGSMSTTGVPSTSGLVYAFGAGYLINNQIDLGVRYETLSKEGASISFIGVRAAYCF